MLFTQHIVLKGAFKGIYEITSKLHYLSYQDHVPSESGTPCSLYSSSLNVYIIEISILYIYIYIYIYICYSFIECSFQMFRILNILFIGL